MTLCRMRNGHVVCSEPRLRWSHILRHRWELSETLWIHYTLDFELMFDHWAFRNIIVAKFFVILTYTTSYRVLIQFQKLWYRGRDVTENQLLSQDGPWKWKKTRAFLKLRQEELALPRCPKKQGAPSARDVVCAAKAQLSCLCIYLMIGSGMLPGYLT